MKSILMSIKPKWCELISEGKKTVEVRKTRPKIDTPFKVYIYESRGDYQYGNADYHPKVRGGGRKKVIGEFICNEIDHITHCGTSNGDVRLRYLLDYGDSCEIDYWFFAMSRLTRDELEEYSGGKDLYGYYISNLKIYDEPKRLGEIRNLKKTKFGTAHYPFERPPQSWCYVEELKGDEREK